MISLAIVGALFMFLSEIMIFIYPCKKVISHGKLAVGGVACFFCILGGKFKVIYKFEIFR